MKKLISMVALGFAAAFMFSCESEDEVMEPINEDLQPDEADLPHFDQSNTTAIPWDEFTAELRDASFVAEEQSNTSANARSGFAFIQGLWGGNGGEGFQMLPVDEDDRVYAVGIRSGRYIDQIKVWYRRPNGTIYYTGSAGRNSGNYFVHVFREDEYIKAIQGRSGRYIDMIGFITNRKWVSYGGSGGEYFYTSVPSKYKINGFFGRAGSVVDQIGCYVFFR